ncbi:MAG TPA: HipA family kinase [Candidatus Dormibacteraeota bacterium]|nr:HipA family kinase [Candidatus Dormibacteraeota bacterium]
MPVQPLRSVQATRYVTPLREGGSLPGIVEADDDGLYVVKFRGAAQGPKALVAELLAGEIGRRLGLPVPEIVLARLEPSLGAAEPDIWVRELLERSPGLNLGLDFLPGALPFTPAVGPAPDPDLAADVVWFDALVTNVDRTPQNTNLLVWHRRLYLIDHGAALYVHHTWRDPGEHARRAFAAIRDHVLLPYAGSIEAADGRLAPLLTEAVLRDLVSLIPDDWLGSDAAIGGPDSQRAAYVDYVSVRLQARDAFVEMAEGARRAA